MSCQHIRPEYPINWEKMAHRSIFWIDSSYSFAISTNAFRDRIKYPFLYKFREKNERQTAARSHEPLTRTYIHYYPSVEHLNDHNGAKQQ